ncbi:MAG: Nif3-like dinuclear metal center hexameric protein [Spirochaetaceae bacterium]|jgi:dinuclear metal center YbgI/SA1388 family protein|nr:Nif3-like dinuclear metal center hexameric protein [Spirochaetaceae bacterium]
MTSAANMASLEGFLNSLLDIESFQSVDSSMNGLQVDNDGSEIRKIVFAVDACMESFCRCAAAGGNMLFVHHGLFWGAPLALKGPHRQRLMFLLDHNIALYAVHLPLDQHHRLGNNAALAELLGIEDPQPFGLYHGRKIGYKGKLKKPLTVAEAARAITHGNNSPLGVYPFGKELNESCAVVSGGASHEALQAIEEGVDLYVTGEIGHSSYYPAMEGRLNLIAGGHYATEVWGVRRVMAECAAQFNIDTEFIDIPTGL